MLTLKTITEREITDSDINIIDKFLTDIFKSDDGLFYYCLLLIDSDYQFNVDIPSQNLLEENLTKLMTIGKVRQRMVDFRLDGESSKSFEYDDEVILIEKLLDKNLNVYIRTEKIKQFIDK